MGFLQKILMAILRPILLLLWGIARMAIFVLILAVAAMIFWRGMFEAAVVNTAEAVLGVPVEVRGGVNVTMDGGLGLAVSDMVVENPDWAVRDNLLKIDTMALYLNPVSMAFGRMYVNEMQVSGLSLALERGAEGAGGATNYRPVQQHLRKSSGQPASLVVGKLSIHDATLFLRDGDRAVEIDIPLMSGRYNPPSSPGALSLDTLSLFARGSDMTASLLVEPGMQRPRISGEIGIGMLDIPRLLQNTPATPQSGNRMAAALDNLLDVVRPLLARTDLNIKLDIDELRLNTMDAQALQTVLRLEGGILRLDDFTARLFDGDAAGDMQLDGSAGRMSAALKMNVTGLSLARLGGAMGMAKPPQGRADLLVELSTGGRSGAEMLAATHGDVRLHGQKGLLPGQTLEVLSESLFKALLEDGDADTHYSCILADFGVKGGRARSRALAMDGRKVVIIGEGAVDLPDEKMDIILKPEPVDPELFSMATDIRIHGSLYDPQINPDTADLATKVGGLLLGTVNPLALTVPFAKIGNSNKPCQRLAENVPGSDAPTKPDAEQDADSQQ